METLVPEQLEAVRCGVRERVLALRCLERLVYSDEFAIAYERACDEQKLQVTVYITVMNLDGLKRWIAKHSSDRDYGELPLRELRSLAQRLGVPHYSRLTKAILLSEIVKYEKKRTSCIVSN